MEKAVKTELNIVYYKNSQRMNEVADNSVDLIITSPPYFNIKDYSMVINNKLILVLRKVILVTMIVMINILKKC